MGWKQLRTPEAILDIGIVNGFQVYRIGLSGMNAQEK
jgi:hypothetical protein